MSSALIRWRDNHAVLMPRSADKDTLSRLNYFIDWLAFTKRSWLEPDLAAYRDYLLYDRIRINPNTGGEEAATLAPRSVAAHLATIRGRYAALLRDNRVRQAFFDLAPEGGTLADRKAFVDEIAVRLQNVVHPSHAPVEMTTIQDEAESEHLRLTPAQVQELLHAPGTESLRGLRDTAIIALFVCTGIREAELVALDVSDLRQYLGGELALRVRHGKGAKQRLVPYGPLDWCLRNVDRWLSAAKIPGGAVFRGIYKGEKRVRKSGIDARNVNRMLNGYPIDVHGTLRDVKPHDLRRTYARNAYERGMDMERIRQNLGHTTLQTTQGYIGSLDASQRRPPQMFTAPED